MELFLLCFVFVVNKVEIAHTKSDGMHMGSLCPGLRICWHLYEFL